MAAPTIARVGVFALLLAVALAKPSHNPGPGGPGKRIGGPAGGPGEGPAGGPAGPGGLHRGPIRGLPEGPIRGLPEGPIGGPAGRPAGGPAGGPTGGPAGRGPHHVQKRKVHIKYSFPAGHAPVYTGYPSNPAYPVHPGYPAYPYAPAPGISYKIKIKKRPSFKLRFGRAAEMN